MSSTPRPAALDGADVAPVCAPADSVGQRTANRASAWSSLMDPELVGLLLTPGYLAVLPGCTFAPSVSSVVPGSEQGATFSAGVAVSLPRPIFLADEPDLLEGSSHD